MKYTLANINCYAPVPFKCPLEVHMSVLQASVNNLKKRQRINRVDVFTNMPVPWSQIPS